MKMPLKYIIWTVFLPILFACASHKQSVKTLPDSTFSVVFMTDIHLQPELNAVEGFRKAMDSINKYNPDFVISGGDLIMDALAQKQPRADSLYTLYKQEVKKLKMPVYNTIGNHEFFGVYPQSGVDSTHEFYGNKMYQKNLGKTYYSFTYKHWKFIVLEAVHINGRKYTGFIHNEQIAWLKKELFNTSAKTPIAVVVHIPMLTSLTQFNKGALTPNNESIVITNSRELINLFSGYNLKLVLQGHLHILEDNFIKNVHFVTGGAICGAWWEGSNQGTEEGFLLLNFKGDQFTWKYVDYGWEPAKVITK